MQLTQEYIEAWTDSVYNAWQAQDAASGGEWYSGWGCILVVVAFMALIGYLRYLDYKEKMAEIQHSKEALEKMEAHDKRIKAAYEELQKGQPQEGEVSEG